jgi:hypothetical protein
MKNRNRLLLEMVALVGLVAFIQLVGIFYGVYAKFWWLDTLNHFLGGAFIGLSSIWFYFYSGYWPKKNLAKTTKNFIFFAVVSTFAVACLWEVYEYILGPFFTYGSYAFDTAKDIFMGTLGSFFGSMYFIKTRHKKYE